MDDWQPMPDLPGWLINIDKTGAAAWNGKTGPASIRLTVIGDPIKTIPLLTQWAKGRRHIAA